MVARTYDQSGELFARLGEALCLEPSLARRVQTILRRFLQRAKIEKMRFARLAAVKSYAPT